MILSHSDANTNRAHDQTHPQNVIFIYAPYIMYNWGKKCYVELSNSHNLIFF